MNIQVSEKYFESDELMTLLVSGIKESYIRGLNNKLSRLLTSQIEKQIEENDFEAEWMIEITDSSVNTLILDGNFFSDLINQVRITNCQVEHFEWRGKKLKRLIVEKSRVKKASNVSDVEILDNAKFGHFCFDNPEYIISADHPLLNLFLSSKQFSVHKKPMELTIFRAKHRWGKQAILDLSYLY